ncbi:16S rRNA (adenine(1518)-N(6)/adenine(1519)-N(6))-dimethyltransferase RsmA [Desulfonatronovibrio hydrogenovorans]|uniref:16S rRNA (adenine(1518)-N(6)/adenine(1519)-N(6))- dimethyltransferase RsmA n=1 Tax=Desulfonatronovibrio hydrogenovorans TaxID=53245 RepID=UPI00048CF2DE|nr:16S rRNA (adenine(1518)-N(6)/adenine(1519)-N(6))-dimethyltransferase RsmA [Desulfonatronovibrio hydrogenovorans]
MSFLPAKRSLGQNFLVDPNICRKIVDALEILPGQTILEIGPGRGALTGLLIQTGGPVFALEKDWELCCSVRAGFPGTEVVCADALHFDWSRLSFRPGIKVVGNLPYNIASRILWDLAHQVRGLERAVFMVQKEVGQRIVASPGNRTYGALSVWIRSFLKPQLLFNVPPQVFRPRPKVDSAVLSFFPLEEAKKNFSSTSLSRLIRIMFQSRRKQVGKILKTYWNDRINIVFDEMGIDLRARPEDLSPEVFQRLSKVIFR